ncbi:MAG: DNA replication/repair protein RecF [Oceanococcus sp.]
MHLQTLSVQNLRCIQAVTLELNSQLNILCGDNGAGKTSLLEAVYLLSRGQSFRTSNVRRLIRDDTEHCLVHAKHVSDQDVITPLALQKTVDKTRIRIGHSKVQRISELARVCPALVIEPGQHRLVEDGPILRRRFLDWSVFHVEHSYHAAWSRFSRVLKQRNHLLRSKRQQELASWTHEYVESAQHVDALRKKVFAELLPIFSNLLKQFFEEDLNLQITYRPGWPTETELNEQLEKQYSQDLERGFTQSGPHRAEIRITAGAHAAKECLSRGQQKLLITALLLAQAEHFHHRLSVQPILLVDDLASELGEKARDVLFDFLKKYQGQCFLTSLNERTLSSALKETSQMFHVKHGEVKAMV